MTNEQYVRELPTSELRAIIAGGLHGKTAAEIREVAQELGITVAELRELVVPTVPSAEQTRELMARVATTRAEAALRKVRDRASRWCGNARDVNDVEAERRVAELLRAINDRLRELCPPSPPRLGEVPEGKVGWGAPAVAPATSAENVVDLGERRSGPRRGDDPVPRGDGLGWLGR